MDLSYIGSVFGLTEDNFNFTAHKPEFSTISYCWQ